MGGGFWRSNYKTGLAFVTPFLPAYFSLQIMVIPLYFVIHIYEIYLLIVNTNKKFELIVIAEKRRKKNINYQHIEKSKIFRL